MPQARSTGRTEEAQRTPQPATLWGQHAQPLSHTPNIAGSSAAQDAPSPSSALHACMATPSREEQNALQLLDSSRKQLEALKLEAPTSSGLDWRRKHGEALQALQCVVARLEDATAQQRLVHGRHRLVQLDLALAEREQTWLRTLPAAGAEAPGPPWPLQSAPGGSASSSETIMSVHNLPPVSQWDASWDARARSLQTLDLLLLHKQWLQYCAIKLPRVQLLRMADAERELNDLYERYNCFTQRVMRLSPERWHESANYSLETLLPLAQPPDAAYVARYWRENFADEWSKIEQARSRYQQVSAVLRAEHATLQRSYAQLAAASVGPAAAGASRACGIMERVVDNAEADELLKRMEANLRQQQLQGRNCVHAINYVVPASVMMTVKVMMFPLAENGQWACQDDAL